MKKVLSLILATAMTMCLFAGCAEKEEPAPESKESKEESVAEQTSTDEETEKLDIIGTGALKYDPNVPVNDGKDITIKFWYDDPGPEGYQRYAKVIEDYQKMHPNVKFDVNKSLGWGDYWAKLPVAVANGTGPDIMHFHLNWYGDFVDNLAEPYPDDMVDGLLKDFVGIEPMMYNDKVYTIPVGNMTGAMFYNKEMWADAGLTDADIPKTWDETREVAKKLTKTDDSGKITVNGMDAGDGYFLLALNYQKGYNVFAEDGKHTQMDNPGALEAAKMIQGLINTDKVFAPGSGASQEKFGNQQTAMMYNWTWCGSWLEGNVKDKFEWGVFPTPTFGDSTKVVDRNNPEVSAVVNAKSSDEAKAVCMDFLKFYFASDEYLVNLADKVFIAPTKSALLNDSTVQGNEVVATIAQYVDKTVWTGIMTSGFDPALTQILTDELILQGKDAKETLKKFDDENANLASEALFETAERKSHLASHLK